MRYNVGQFSRLIDLLEPSTPTRDAIGGIGERTYEKVATVRGMKRDKTSTYKAIIGAYVTIDTVYYIIRDVRKAYNISTDWRMRVDGHTYVINSISVLDDTPPYFLEIEATKITTKGGM